MWSHLPSELLTLIAQELGILELLRFRAVCKHWFAASSPCSAEIESSGMPWLLASPVDGSGTNYILCNETDTGTYSISIPELEGKICLASNEGWLLLSRGNQVFFFCPFSSAKVELPEFPHADLTDHVAAFSFVPTDQECVVAVLNRCNEQEVELHVITRGENTWTRYSYNLHKRYFDTLTCGTWCENNKFYFLADKETLFTFSPKKKSIDRYRTVSSHDYDPSRTEKLPFISERHYLSSTDRKMLPVSESATVSTCGTMVRTPVSRYFIHNEVLKGSSEESHVICIHPRFHQILRGQGWSR